MINNRQLIKKIRELQKIKPGKVWKETLRKELLANLHKYPTNITNIGEILGKFVSIRKFAFRPIFITGLILIVLFSGSAITIQAAMKSLPGQFLYPLKIVFEKARIALALKEGDKVELEVEYATRRLDELEQIIQKEEPEEVIKTVANFQEKLNTVKSALETIDETYPVSKAIKIAKKVDQKTREFEDVLDKTEKNLPEKELKKKIKEVKEVVDKTNTQALKVMVECQIEEEEILPRIEDKIEKIEETLERPEVKKALEEAKEALAKKNFSIALEIIEKIQETEEEVVETEEEVVETEIKETTQPAQESQVEEVQSFKEDYKKDGDEKDRAEKEKKDDEAEEVKIKADFKGDLILEPEEGVFGGLLKIEN